MLKRSLRPTVHRRALIQRSEARKHLRQTHIARSRSLRISCSLLVHHNPPQQFRSAWNLRHRPPDHFRRIISPGAQTVAAITRNRNNHVGDSPRRLNTGVVSTAYMLALNTRNQQQPEHRTTETNQETKLHRNPLLRSRWMVRCRFRHAHQRAQFASRVRHAYPTFKIIRMVQRRQRHTQKTSSSERLSSSTVTPLQSQSPALQSQQRSSYSYPTVRSTIKKVPQNPTRNASLRDTPPPIIAPEQPDSVPRDAPDRWHSCPSANCRLGAIEPAKPPAAQADHVSPPRRSSPGVHPTNR